MCDSQYRVKSKCTDFWSGEAKLLHSRALPLCWWLTSWKGLSVSLHFYGPHCSNLSSFLVKWWSHFDCKSPVVKRFRLLNYSF